MNRSITLSLTLAVALASQVALGGCSKKEDVATPAPDATAPMSASSTPMDSISSASAVAGSDAASGSAMAASDAGSAASR